ncbi:MAG: hypothetical protein ACYDCO_04190 [Armatimonadota bacterium]
MRCSYCRHYEGGACAHPRAHVHFAPDLEAAKSCPAFRSQFEVRDSRLLAQLPAPLWVVFLLTLIVGSLTAAAWFIDPYGRYFFGNPLDLRADVPAMVTVGKPFTVTLRITNLLDKARSTPVYIEVIGNEYQLVSASSQPRKITYNSEHFVLEYPPLDSGAMQSIRLQMVQRKLGGARFIARVYAPANHQSHEVNTEIFALR